MIDPEQSTANLRHRHVSLLVRWLDKPQTLDNEELNECLGALFGESLEQMDSIATESVLNRYNAGGSMANLGFDVQHDVRIGIHRVK
jgi:hypothetical protein